MKVYFAQYETVISMDLNDAIKLCNDALTNETWYIENKEQYPSLKVLKVKNRREKGYMLVGKKYVDVYHCLDWDDSEWEYALKTLTSKL